MKRSAGQKRIRRIIREAAADTQERTSAQTGDLLRFWRVYLAGHHRAMAGVLVTLVTWSAVPYCFALTHRYMIDAVLGPTHGTSRDHVATVLLGLWMVFGINMALHTVNLVCHWITSFFTLKIGRDVAMRMRDELYHKLDALHVDYYDRTQTGRIVARVQADVGQVQNTIQGHLPSLLVEPLKLTVGFAVLFWMDWRLARILAVAAPIYAVIFLLLRPLIRTNSTAQSRLTSRLYGLTSERLGAILVVKAFGMERAELGRFGRSVHNGVRLARHHAWYPQGLSFAAGTVSTVAVSALLLSGLMSVRDGLHGATLGSVVAFVHLSQQVFQPIQTLTAMAAVLQTSMVSLRRVFTLLDEPCPSTTGNIALSGMTGKLRFDRVSFSYPQQIKPAIREVSFQVAAGEHVAIMGPSGSGKSTLFSLLLRFYEPQEGQIYVGGVSLSDVDVASLRRHVRYVQQEPFIFSGSIAENMRYGCPDATEAEISETARLVEMHDTIMELPDKCDTLIGENGVGLSGGQRQRIALATALLTRPEVLLLDDTTSALDAETEARIRETLRKILTGRTSLIITQRIATARNCDRIIVLEDGCITQIGTHATLVAEEGGFYRRICEQQDAW